MYRSPWEQRSPSRPLDHLLGTGELDLTGAPRPIPRVVINGRPLDEPERQRLGRVERELRFRLAAGNYWYDDRSGLLGRIGGPTAGMLPPGLGLGGVLAADSSGGDSGIFLNDRELHDLDVRVLERLYGRFTPGRYTANRGLQIRPEQGASAGLSRDGGDAA